MTDLNKLLCTDSKVESLVKINSMVDAFDEKAEKSTIVEIEAAINNKVDLDDMVEVNIPSPRALGEYVWSSIPLNDATLHLPDGTVLDGNGIYKAFVSEIADRYSKYPSLFIAEAEWQASVEQYGVCGKYVYDATANTVRLPKITGFVEGTLDVSALGDLVEAGLPNITGSAANVKETYVASGEHSGCLYYSSTSSYISDSASASGGAGLAFDASLSNAIYGNSDTVQPQAIKGYMYIVVATGTKTDIDVDIDNIVTDLNNKVDVSNMVEVPCIVETYQNGTSWYYVRSDGWCEQGGLATQASGNVTITLLKSYKDLNYTISHTAQSTVSNDYVKLGTSDITVSGFTAYWNGDSSSSKSIYWHTMGYIA